MDDAQLNAILEVGRLGSTAKNLQEQKIYVVQSEEGLSKIDKATPCRYGASTCIVVAFDSNHVFTYPGEKRFWHRGCYNCGNTYDSGCGKCWCRQLLD